MQSKIFLLIFQNTKKNVEIAKQSNAKLFCLGFIIALVMLTRERIK